MGNAVAEYCKRCDVCQRVMSLTSDIEQLIADLLQWKGNCIVISYCDVQWQVGDNDCSIFCNCFCNSSVQW